MAKWDWLHFLKISHSIIKRNNSFHTVVEVNLKCIYGLASSSKGLTKGMLPKSSHENTYTWDSAGGGHLAKIKPILKVRFRIKDGRETKPSIPVGVGLQ